ncbi:hypothetical protein ACT3CD_10815 [Geofilum sp. OHC36d9]|uniref:hypothetical protein n=1 Tax=Geofilum sp. OHC36d9 TaxID=3458413 RepID=UPI004033C129
MKLSKDIKSKIDHFFENITPEELYNLAVTKYGFKSEDILALDDQPFSVINKLYYATSNDDLIDTNQVSETSPLAA